MSSARSPVRWLVMVAASAAAWSVGAQTSAPGAPATTPPARTAVASEPPSLGRFFFTPTQRVALDEARRRPAVAARAERPPLPPPPEYVTLNGVVRHSDGTTVVWLNNKPVRGGQSDEGLQVAPTSGAPTAGNVTVRVPQTGRIVNLKVGQQVEVTSGQVQEAYRVPPRAESVPETPSSAPPSQELPTPRRANRDRDRDLVRDLLRELDAPYRVEPPAARPPAQTAEPGR